MTDRRTVESPEYQEGYLSAKVNGDDPKAYNPYIAGTSAWHRWGVGWDDYFQEAKEVASKR